jgi:acetyl-CoA carboxylase biotin carboxylase subunit
MFRKVLIANRGEIALRVQHTLRELGVASVAVYSEPDALAPHATSADEAYAIGPAEAARSYLDQERLLEVAQAAGCDAVHPGYGFLSENAEFARRCAAAGITFIGPPPDAIAAMGSKIGSRALMQKARVPVVPGTDGATQDVGALEKAAKAMGYPVLVKASAGGGGKGMRVVHNPAEFRSAVELARGEAEKAFGDGTVYLEKYLERPRHIEFQIFADDHGNVVHLFERECSIQRRHQKIVEETPSPLMNAALRARMGEAAVAAARAVGYRGAGTVEFMVDARGDFYFLEMNTRLQVEHPITELVTGLDLVRLQLEVASGAALPPAALEPVQRGHAMECRVYAEDPAHGFLPAAGRIVHVRFPEGPGVRVDGALRDGLEISIHYDPMLAKVIASGRDRDECIARMRRALAEFVVIGIPTNLTYLQAILATDAFARGQLSTHFLDDHLRGWKPDAVSLPEAGLAALALHELLGVSGGGPGSAGSGPGGAGPAATPWTTLAGWRPLENGGRA